MLRKGQLSESEVRRIIYNVEEKLQSSSSGSFQQLMMREVQGIIESNELLEYNFYLMSELFPMLAECHKYDITSLRLLLKWAAVCVAYAGEVLLSSCQSSLRPLHIWNNLPLWVDASDQIIKADLKNIDLLFSVLDTDASKLLYQCSRSQIKLLVIATRIQAIAEFMKKSLNLSSDTITSYTSAVISKYRLFEMKIDVSAISLHKLTDLLFKENGILIAQQSSFISPSSLKVLKTNAGDLVTGLGDACLPHDIGYDITIPLLFLPSYLHLLSKQSSFRATNQQQKPPSTCICGRYLYPWQLTSLPTAEEIAIYQKIAAFNNVPAPLTVVPFDILMNIPTWLCETCYRSSYRDCNGHNTNISPSHHSNSGKEEVIAVGQCPNLTRNDQFTLDPKVMIARYHTDEFEQTVHNILRVPMISTYVLDSVEDEIPTPKARVQALSHTNSSHSIASQLAQSRITPRNPVNRGTSGGQQHHHHSHSHAPSMDLGDDMSVLSGFAKIDNDDDESVAKYEKKVKPSEVLPFSTPDFHQFIRELWNGTMITLVYSTAPPIEKTRLLYLRSDSRNANEVLVSVTSSKAGRQAAATESFADVVKQRGLPLYLGWARKSEAAQIEWNPKKSIAVQSIRNIKVGSKKWKCCIKVATDAKIIVLRIDEDDRFQWLLRGLTQLIAVGSAT